ncbi:MAG: hypothetical protein LBN21_08450, partial [Treponema sp.]|nr:hypothetical protein [Treponema sp.]
MVNSKFLKNKRGLFAVLLAAAVIMLTGCPAEPGDEPPTKEPKTWTLATLPEGITGTFSNIAFGKGVFVAATSEKEIIWSADGVTWTKVTQDLSTILNTTASYVFFGNDGFVIADRTNNTTGWAKSSDGKIWSAAKALPAAGRAAGSGAYGNNTWVIGANGGVFTSTDATTWEAL